MATEIRIRVNAAQLKALGPQLKKVGVNFKTLEKQSVASAGLMSKAFGLLQTRMIAFGATIAGVALLKNLVSFAADVTEALNLVKQTFGDAADLIISKSEESARAVNLSRGEFLGLSGEVGSLFKSFGFGNTEAAKLTNKIITLSAEIASFKNARPEEVFIAIRAGLIGSSEPLLRFGADVREDNLRTRAFAAGIIETNRALTQQERTFAVLNEVMRSNADAIGDIERTRKDFTVGTKELFANFKTLGENVGQFLIPSANALVQILNKGFGADNTSNVTTMSLGMEVIAKKMASVAEDALKSREEFEKAAKIATEQGFIKQLEDPFGFKQIEEDSKSFAETQKDIFIAIAEEMDKLGQLNIETFTAVADKLGIVVNVTNDLLGLQVKQNEEQDKQQEKGQNSFERTKRNNQFILTSADTLEAKRGELFEVGEDLLRQQDTMNVATKEFGSIWDVIPSRAAELLPVQMEIAIAAEAAAEAGEEQAESAKKLEVVTGNMVQNLVRGLATGRELGDILKSTALQIGLSFLPGGSLFKGFGAQQGLDTVVPPGFPNDSAFLPLRVSSGERVTVTPAGQVDNRQDISVQLNLPNVRTLDKFTLRTEIIPLINEIVAEGGILRASNV